MIKSSLRCGALFFCLFLGVSVTCTAGEKSVFLVPMPKTAGWQDQAYLATIPAATRINDGKPVVIALDRFATLRPETEDFLRRYKPDETYVLKCLEEPMSPAAGLVSKWSFDEGKGVTVRSKVAGLTGTIHRLPAWKANKAGGYAFNGQAITVVNGTTPGSSPELTVAFWMNVDEVKNQVVIGKLNRKEKSPGWAILLRDGKQRNAIRFRIGGGGAAWHQSDLAVDDAYKAGDWVHVACTFADGVSKVYLNGKLKGTRNDITYSTPNNATDPLLIGSTGWEPFKALMDELRIYDRALEPLEVERLPGAQGPTTRGMVAHWPLNETEGTLAKNAAGSTALRITGNAKWAKGHVGGAIRFNGEKDGLKGEAVDSTKPLTVLCRLQPKANQTCIVLSKDGVADRLPPWCLSLDTGTLVFRIGDETAEVRTPQPLKANESVTVMALFHDGTMALCLDGQIVTSKKNVTWRPNSSPYAGPRLEGNLDQVRIYDRAVKPATPLSTDGLVASWDMDPSLNRSPIPFWAEGRSGGGLALDGKFVYAEYLTQPRDSDELTVAFWVKPKAPGCIVGRLPESRSEPGWAISLHKDRHTLLFEVDGRRTGLRHAESCPVGQWTHVTCTYANGVSRIYLNGRLSHTRRGIKKVQLKALTAPVRIGAFLPGEGHFAGIVDELCVFDRAVSELEARGLFGKTKLPADSVFIHAKDAESAACTLASKFWGTSDRVVSCAVDNYEDALVASALAARLRVPLLYRGKNGYTKPAMTIMRALRTKHVLFVGANADGPKGLPSVRLKDDLAVLKWMKENRVTVDYLAAVNPQDSQIGLVRKSSLAGPLLAAGRNGAVAILDFETRWKLPFDGTETVKTRIEGTPESKEGWRTGTIALDGKSHPFVLTATRPKTFDQITIKLDKEMSIGPLTTGDKVRLGNRDYVISLGRKDGIGEHDVRLTWPTEEVILKRLKLRYEALGMHPEYLCIVGRPDVIPQAILLKPAWRNEDLPSDIPFAEADEDPFSEIAVGRFVAEDVWSATLIASRGLVYDHLIDPSWANRCATACWESLMDKDFQNVGFGETVHHSGKILFSNDSPLRSAAAIAHMEHSSWLGLGGFVDWQSKVLLAPAVIETGGCSTMSLDRNEDGWSAPLRLLRNGAVAVAGNVRLGTGPQKHYRTEFWGALLDGKSVGQAHRDASNKVLLAVLEKKQLKRGGDRYQYLNRALYGDPAVTVRLPSKPKSKRAHAAANGDSVTVIGPEVWWRYDEHIVKDWRYTLSPKLYAFRGAGVGAERLWNHKKRCGTEKSYFVVGHRTRKPVTKVEQLDTLPKPLGWTGQFWTDHHQDGSRTILWRVRLIDFDRQKGTIIHKADKVTYKLATE